MIKISGKDSYKEFKLIKEFSCRQGLIVMTGRNGSGKTRLLESIKNKASVVSWNGMELDGQIVYFEQSSLKPDLGVEYDDVAYTVRRDYAVGFFEKNKNDFIEPFNSNKYLPFNVRGMANALEFKDLYLLVSAISKRLDVPVEELEADDIRGGYDGLHRDLFGSRSLSSVFNVYLRNKEQNLYNTWRSEKYGKKINVIPEDKIAEHFGREPWEIVNSLVGEIFDGKFEFSVPDTNSLVFDHKAVLVERESKKTIEANSLSSGEQTLLWLALTLFNSQYPGLSGAEPPKLLLLDEPDAFLHPKMVSKLYRVLFQFSEVFGAVVVITTHSPTTVALAPGDVIYMVGGNDIKPVAKDNAIAELLEGVNQISIDPENRRQVFVESFKDRNIYSALYAKLRDGPHLARSEVSLEFVLSGAKLPVGNISDAVKGVLKDIDEELVGQIVAALNGIGSCAHVYAAVEGLVEAKNKYVRGLVDWDSKNKARNGVVVFAEGYAYTIESLAFDPICVLAFLYIEVDKKYSIKNICGEDADFGVWNVDSVLLQQSLNLFFMKVFGRPNLCDVSIEYVNGVVLMTDSEYLNQGKELINLVVKAYPELNGFIKKQGAEKCLAYTIVSKSMIKILQGRFIPVAFAQAFSELQAD